MAERIGPRARRRLLWLVAAVVVAAVAGLLVAHFTRSSGEGHAKNTPGAPEDLGVPFGASAAQVVRRLGRPSAKERGCWIYKVENGAKTIGHGFGQWIDKVRFCFGEGPTGGRAVSRISSHMVAHRIGKKHYPAGWSGLVVLYVAPKPQ